MICNKFLHFSDSYVLLLRFEYFRHKHIHNKCNNNEVNNHIINEGGNLHLNIYVFFLTDPSVSHSWENIPYTGNCAI